MLIRLGRMQQYAPTSEKGNKMESTFKSPEEPERLTAKTLRRRVSQIQAIEDPKLRRKARAKLSRRVLRAIAQGQTSPVKASTIVLSLFD